MALLNNTNTINGSSMMNLGVSICGFRSTSNTTKIKRFRSLFGIDPETCSKLFRDLQSNNNGNDELELLDPYLLLMTLYWIRSYAKITAMAGLFHMNEKTVTKWIWKYSRAIQALKEKKIQWRWDNRNESEEGGGEIFIASIDGTHCRIYEQRMDPGSKWFSHKFKGPALNYEIGVDIYVNKLVWINGPFPAGQINDIGVFRSPGGVKDRIPHGKKVIADRGYRGEEAVIGTPNPHDTLNTAKFKQRARARHETVNKRIKDFQVIAQRFRHKIDKHKIVFETICVLVQYDIEGGHPLFEV